MLWTESCRWTTGREIARGADTEAEVLSDSNSTASSSANESRLFDRLGAVLLFEYRPSGLLEEMEIAGVVEFASETGSQQKVSRFHSLQLKFSNRLPSSSEPAHREKTVIVLVEIIGDRVEDERLPVHMLKRFSTLRVSTL